MDAIDRRSFIIGLPLSGLAWAAQSATGAPDNSQNISAEQWMQSWMGAPGAIAKPLQLGRFQDPVYFLLSEIGWEPSATQKNLPPVRVPEGFVSDLASIPQVFWSALRPDGNYAYAAIIHDYLYWFQPFPREDADLVFKYVMEDLGVESTKINLIYNAVRTGGKSAWETNKKSREEGEKRILIKYPDNPRVTWTMHKRQKDVFR